LVVASGFRGLGFLGSMSAGDSLLKITCDSGSNFGREF